MFNKRILSIFRLPPSFRLHIKNVSLLVTIRINGVVDYWFVGVFLLSRVTVFSRVLTLIRYIEVDFTFGPPDNVRYIEEFVISRFYSIHFTVTLVGT